MLARSKVCCLGAVAEALSGGEGHCPSCFAPTVLRQPPSDARVMREEIFVPVVCVTPYDELDRALRASTRLDASARTLSARRAGPRERGASRERDAPLS